MVVETKPEAAAEHVSEAVVPEKSESAKKEKTAKKPKEHKKEAEKPAQAQAPAQNVNPMAAFPGMMPMMPMMQQPTGDMTAE